MAKIFLEHQTRVQQEYNQLNERIIKLTEFIYGGKSDFLEIPENERHRIMHQHRAMCDYSNILQERISDF